MNDGEIMNRYKGESEHEVRTLRIRVPEDGQRWEQPHGQQRLGHCLRRNTLPLLSGGPAPNRPHQRVARLGDRTRSLSGCFISQMMIDHPEG